MEEALKLHKLKHKCGLNFNDDIDLDTLKQKTKQPDRNYIVNIICFILGLILNALVFKNVALRGPYHI